LTKLSRDTPQFYLTAPAPCPYLPGRFERKVFTHLVGDNAPVINDMLSQGGFRRSQSIAYRPACESCKACVSVRVCVDLFRPSKSQRRVWKRNSDLVGEELPPRPSGEQYALFRDYLDTRHADGGMAGMSVLDYAMMIEESHVDTRIVEYRMRGPDSGITRRGTGDIVALSLTDVLADGLSMVYSFYDPGRMERGLGTYMILDHIARARRMGLSYLYLGYWVRGSDKMGYKVRFLPQEHLTGAGWRRIDTDPSAA
jgi:leucyl-tRNA---protein transferase